jgi:aspartate racemase
MATVGIIGGLGPEATIEYYRLLIAGYRAARPDGGYPSIIVNSIDMRRLLGAIEGGDLAAATDHLAGSLEQLHRAGADFALLASNTPHLVFDQLRRRSPIPLVSIVESACADASRRGLTRLGLLGTRFTMRGSFYPTVFSRAGITLVVPEPAEQEVVHARYMDELVSGLVREETRAEIVTIVESLRRRHAIEGLILGGTELTLLFRGPTVDGLEVLDTTRVHVADALARLLA